MGRDMTSKVVPFPQVRRRRFIARHAIRLTGFPYKTAEKLLAATLRQQAEVMGPQRHSGRHRRAGNPQP
jgi:hypothetical protein